MTNPNLTHLYFLLYPRRGGGPMLLFPFLQKDVDLVSRDL